jgi:D-3-phosphoglycerate dehydrogenase
MDSTRGILGEKAFAAMKDGVRILNLARGELVDNDAMLSALDSGKVACYVTDFPDNKILTGKNVMPIPHLGASTPESEDNCAVMAAVELREYLVYGNICNSVNMPNVEMAPSTDTRVCILHRNIPNMLASITNLLSAEKDQRGEPDQQSKKDYAYTIVDINTRCPIRSVTNLPPLTALPAYT